MKTFFTEMRSTDCIAMHGVLFEPDEKTDTIVIHHHGIEGNFYENTFIPFMAEAYTSAGIAFMTYNNRGHDYICDLKMDTSDGVKSLKGGTAFEKIADNAMDVLLSIARVGDILKLFYKDTVLVQIKLFMQLQRKK